MEIKYICSFWGQGHLSADEFVNKALNIFTNLKFNRYEIN